jgi:TM2 domain-containing membrane protein YozV
MTGQIIEYDAETGAGLVVSDQHESYSFSGEAWGGRDLPYVGQLVEFETYWTGADFVIPAQETIEPGIIEVSSNLFNTGMDVLRTVKSRNPVSPSSGKVRPEKTNPVKIYTEKSKIAAFLLALFFGVYGVHKFYLGYVIQGFIHLAAIVVLAPLFFSQNDFLMIIGLILAYLVIIVPFVEAWIYLGTSREKFHIKYVESRHPWF